MAQSSGRAGRSDDSGGAVEQGRTPRWAYPTSFDRCRAQVSGARSRRVDNEPKVIRSLDPADERQVEIKVATPAALMVAKLHKLGERHESKPARLDDKDAHDLYRLLVAIPTRDLVKSLDNLRGDELSAEVTARALEYLKVLFADGPEAPGSQMAGRAEGLAGDPVLAAASAATLASDLLQWGTEG